MTKATIADLRDPKRMETLGLKKEAVMNSSDPFDVMENIKGTVVWWKLALLKARKEKKPDNSHITRPEGMSEEEFQKYHEYLVARFFYHQGMNAGIKRFYGKKYQEKRTMGKFLELNRHAKEVQEYLKQQQAAPKSEGRTYIRKCCGLPQPRDEQGRFDFCHGHCEVHQSG